jgi:hypothetical protein
MSDAWHWFVSYRNKISNLQYFHLNYHTPYCITYHGYHKTDILYWIINTEKLLHQQRPREAA